MAREKTKIVTVKLDEQTEFLVRAKSQGGEQDVSIGDALKFEAVTNVIGGIAKGIKKTLDQTKPKKVTVEFGLEVGIESGKALALLVDDTAQANLKITLEWGE
ncbi:CU044_2847 family protein [[Limnothrix rosea] IAM M-220]|uniref:CU044_2847 family protein n=1 Tax=[Limnothrix rosea] IAM M-220 TaxID=454133 RepID=UPI0009679E37|nr:CU044_2847 family protein [[Limnothrix rosea] IAM M-220]OKH17625.1 hypothetical protein NIES208_08955 [[Limnothrix rosea] IAM M-220]